MSAAIGLARWHKAMQSGATPDVLAPMLADDAVFHSPVVHTPQRGKALVSAYLTAATHVFADSGFAYVRELIGSSDAALEFTAAIDGIQINGVDMIRFDTDGRIVDFKVMVRPLKAVNKLWDMMATQLGR